MSERQRVAVIYGGVSGEHEVSVRSARSVASALEEAGYEVVRIYIDKGGTWRLGGEDGRPVLQPRGRLLLGCGDSHPPAEGPPAKDRSRQRATSSLERPGVGDDALTEAGGQGVGAPRFDVVFPVLHGTLGEDGTLQGLLEIAEIPYVGSGVLGSAVGMDKIVMKRLFLQAGLPVADFVEATRRGIAADPEGVAVLVEECLGYPCFVKPANLGSSVGISKAWERQQLLAGLSTAARYDRRVIAEKGIDAREIEVSVLGNDEPVASVAGEVIPGREFYDYAAKYEDAGSDSVIPANLDRAASDAVRQMAVEAFKVLDLAGMARVDFLLDRRSGVMYVNEVNTIPGFTDISMYARLWEATGMTFAELVDRLVGLAWERYAERQASLAAVRGGGERPREVGGGR